MRWSTRLIALTIMATLAISLVNGCSARPTTPAEPGPEALERKDTSRGDTGSGHVADAGQPDIEEAARRGLPAVIKMGSDSCSPCRKMKPVMEELAGHYDSKVLFLTVDVYKHPDLASKYQVRVIPKIIFIDPAGNAVAYIEGYQSVDRMKSLIEESGILK